MVISCNPWSTSLCPYPSLIRKTKTYLELEGKLGPKPRPQPQTPSQPCTSTPSQINNSLTWKTPGPKMAEKKRRTRAPVKRRYKVRLIAQPLPTTPTLDCTHEPNSYSHSSHFYCIHPNACGEINNHNHSSDCTQFVTGEIQRNSLPTGRPQVKEKPSAPSCSPPQQRPQLEATQCPNLPGQRRHPLA